MLKSLQNRVLSVTGAKSIIHVAEIQELWSGYGKIWRFTLEESKCPSIVVKQVKIKEASNHPRGWNTSTSHMRKIKSYEVETEWYNKWSERCTSNCKVPDCFYINQSDDEILIILEDLNASGYNERKTSVSWTELETCVSWLANFHSTFLNCTPTNLWSVGTYWHLDTRPDELEALSDKALKNAAKTIDAKLNNANYTTFVHGDAKLANFCFSKDGKKVAAVDFQYVGGGCGMKDLAYFMGSCLYEDDCEKYETQLLDLYFGEFEKSVLQSNKRINFEALENEWRNLYPYAWTDFHRFLKGWSPGHWKINTYSEKLCREVINEIRL